jgi:acyl-CoA thioester hydrolase
MQSVTNAWQFTVVWGDLDANQHMRNTAYLDYAAQSRFIFLALTLELAGMSEDGARFALANAFTNARGELAATVRSDGAWFALDARRVQPPPDGLLAAMNRMPRATDFRTLTT